MSEPAHNLKTIFAIFKQSYTLKLFIAFTMVYSSCFRFGENQDFLDFLQKYFYNIDYSCQSFRRTRIARNVDCTQECHLFISTKQPHHTYHLY